MYKMPSNINSKYYIIHCYLYYNIMLFLKLAVRPKLWRSCRLSITICVFLASVQISMLRDNFGITLICMSKPTGDVRCEKNDAVMPTLPCLTHKQVQIVTQLSTYLCCNFSYIHQYITNISRLLSYNMIYILNIKISTTEHQQS